MADFNPRSPCGERRAVSAVYSDSCTISTHAPRVGSDADVLQKKRRNPLISTHAPRVGSDYNSIVK